MNTFTKSFFRRLINLAYIKTHRSVPQISSFVQIDSGAKWLRRSDAEDIEVLFCNHDGRVIHKWTHYLEIYSKYFEKYRNKSPRLLEIGVSLGGSLELWRKYFGEDAVIFGIDVDPECTLRVDRPNQVRIGSQEDPIFLRSVITEMGAPDIIIDDGSHVGRHQIVSFNTLFPLLRDGGIYIIEDLHTSYWPIVYEGGLKRAGTGVDLIKSLIDEMHDWYHCQSESKIARDWIPTIHIFDSLVVIEKSARVRPSHVKSMEFLPQI